MIVGLTGSKGCGKDTFAQALQEKGFILVRFADPMKAMLRTLFQMGDLPPELIEEMIEGSRKEKGHDLLCGKSPRHAMQTLGTEWRDLIGRDLWANIWARGADRLQGFDIVTPDVRFLHEVAPIKRREGLIVRIERPGRHSNDAHISEVEMRKIDPDVVIVNDGTIQDLHEKALEFLHDYRS